MSNFVLISKKLRRSIGIIGIVQTIIGLLTMKTFTGKSFLLVGGIMVIVFIVLNVIDRFRNR